MKRVIKFLAIPVLGLLLYVLLGSSCLPKYSFAVEGYLFNKPIKTTVDSKIAGLMLSNPNDKDVTELYKRYNNRALDTETLAEVAAKYSIDAATIYYVQKNYQDSKNKQAQDLYLSFIDELTVNNKQGLQPLLEYYVAFVPGLAYNDTINGGNFARQRRLLSAAGVANEMIVTEEWGMTDRNAEVIALRLKELSKLHEKIIVVSASKGGLETAVALGKVLKPSETSAIKAWVSVGGVLRGSPVADTYLCWPKCWVAEIGLMTKGQNISLIKDVSYSKRLEEYKQLHFPENIKIVHFVGAPLATRIHKRIKGLYCSIKEFGPNDGLTPLADEVTENGIVISELGLDHHYKHPDIDKKTIALALVVSKIQN